MALYVARKTWRNGFLWWLRQRALDASVWCYYAIDYERCESDGRLTYVGTYSFFDAATGKETPVSPLPPKDAS